MSLFQTCSKCGHISQACSKCGHKYSQTCHDGGENSIMLFGVQLTGETNNNNTNNTNDNNNNNLSQYQKSPPQVSTSTNASNVSNNAVHALAGSRKSKRDIWTEEEHMMFLKGLKHIDKGKWDKGKWIEISNDFVKTRTPTQIASHAQKHFLHRSNQNRRRGGKPSVFDLTIDTEVEYSTIMEDEQIQQETVVPLPPPIPTAYPSIHNGGSPTDTPLPIGLGPVALPVRPLSWVDLNDDGSSSSTENFSLSLKMQSLSPSDNHSPETSGHSSSSASLLASNSMSAEKSNGGSGDVA